MPDRLGLFFVFTTPAHQATRPAPGVPPPPGRSRHHCYKASAQGVPERWRCGRASNPSTWRVPQHQGRADHGAPGNSAPSAPPAPAPQATRPAPGVPPAVEVRACMGRAPGHQASAWRARGGGVPDRGHPASGHSTSTGQTVGHQASTWRAPKVCPPAPAPAPAPCHQFNR